MIGKHVARLGNNQTFVHIWSENLNVGGGGM